MRGRLLASRERKSLTLSARLSTAGGYNPSMRAWWKTWGPRVKLAFAIVLLAAIGRRFYLDLQKAPDPRTIEFEPVWIAVCGVLYLLGLLASGTYWHRLLVVLGQPIGLLGSLRAYYLGHLGKYLPGKAWALLMRTSLAGAAGVRVGVAALTTFYEVLATMASGALLAVLFFLWTNPSEMLQSDWNVLAKLGSSADLERDVLVQLSPFLLALVLVPIVPPVFNRLVRRTSNPFLRADAAPLPEVGWRSFFEGLVWTQLNWLLLGASLCALLRGWPGLGFSQSASAWLHLSACLSFSYVAGFVVVFMPNGIGVREFMLTIFLAPEFVRGGMDPAHASGQAALVVVILRLVWSVAEVLLAGIIWLIPYRGRD